MPKPVIDYNKCINCKTCINVCPAGVYANDESGKVVVKNPSACIGCKACEVSCPVKAIVVEE